MEYIAQLDKILVINYDKVFIADPYTLKVESKVSLPLIEDVILVESMNYAVITLTYNQLVILDVTTLSTVKVLDNTNYLSKGGVKQLYSKLFTLSTGEKVLICSDSQGLYSWTITFGGTIESTFNGYIAGCNFNFCISLLQNLNTQIAEQLTVNQSYLQRRFDKHSTQDLLVLGGQSFEIKFIQIKSIKDKDYFVYTVDPNPLYPGHTNNIESITFRIVDGKEVLIVGDKDYLYKIEYTFKDQTTINLVDTTYYYYEPNYYEGYQLKESPILIYSSKKYVTFYDYQNNLRTYNLYFFSDEINRRFMLEGYQNGEDFYLLTTQYSMNLYKRGYLGRKIDDQKPLLKTPILLQYNSIYRVKSCDTCFFIKSYSSTNSHSYISFSNFANLVDPSYEIDITDKLNLQWSQINQNLDPFQKDNFLWVTLGFPQDNTSPDYYFQLLKFNENDLTIFESSLLYTGQKVAQTSFALSNMADNQIIGVDLTGNIYLFDFTTKTLVNKYPTQCKNSKIGELFISKTNDKFLIIVCDDFSVLVFNLSDKSSQNLESVNLTSIPIALKGFTNSGVIGIGDTNKGAVKIYKFNNTTKKFDFLIELYPGKNKDNIIGIEILKDNTLWLQFTYSNLFYPLQQCLDDANNCIICNQQYYFKPSNILNSDLTYGKGLPDSEFSTSQNFLSAMIKAQLYKDVIRATSNMQVSIKIDNTYPFILSKGLLNFDFNNIISLTFQCTNCQTGQYATFQFSDQLVFENFLQINMNQINVSFVDLQAGENCGITFLNISQNSSLVDIQITNDESLLGKCNAITIENSIIKIDMYSIKNKDLSNHKSIITISDSSYVTLNNFVLFNCILGRNFSILSQQNNVNAILNSITINQNKCPQTVQDDNIVSSLFSAGLFTVTDFNLLDNNFCNTIIFSTVASLQHIQQVFSFTNLIITGNNFVVKTVYILFNALYSMRSSPSHEVYFNKLTIKNNKLTQVNKNTDQPISSFIVTSKIYKNQFTEVTFTNHIQLFIATIDTSNTVQMTNFYCTNDLDYNNIIITAKKTAGCLYFNEVANIKLKTIRLLNKRIKDTSLITLENYFTQTATFNINDGEFYNNSLVSVAGNVETNPIFILTLYSISFTVTDCHFYKNIYETTKIDRTILSTTGIGAQFYAGTISINQSTFKESTSSGAFNYISIIGDTVEMDNVQFDRSSFADQVVNQNFLLKQYGGNLNLKVKSIFFTNCDFSKSTAYQGAFIYAEPNASMLEIYIGYSSFTEGYASNNGGAIYMYPSNTIQFNCEQCHFKNIYTLNIGVSASLAIENSASLDNAQHSLIFAGGSIINVYGNGDNYFTQLVNVDFYFSDYQTIKSEAFPSLYLDLIKRNHLTDTGLQLALLFDIKDSTFSMENVNISDWNQLKISLLPLILRATNTITTIDNSNFSNGDFKEAAIKIVGGSLVLSKVSFDTFTQIQTSRLLIEEKQPQSIGNSLIKMQDSKLTLKKQSNFASIKCTQNCNGSTLQLIKTPFNIQDTKIINSQSTFGGAIYANGLTGDNQIIKCNFNNNVALYDGGGAYIQAGLNDEFTLKIDGSQFNENTSTISKGGAFYIFSSVFNPQKQLIQITNSEIKKNTAQVGGGIFNENIAPQVQSYQITNNVGIIFGSNQLSYPTQLVYLNMGTFLKNNKDSSYQNGILTIKNFRSGANLPSLSLQFKNNEDIIYPLTPEEINSYSIKIGVYKSQQNSNQYDVSGGISSKYNEQQFSFELTEVKVIGQPGTSGIFELTSNQIKILDPITQKYVQNYSLKLNIVFRECQFGEESQNYNSLTECTICPEGSYSFDDTGCKPCPEGGTCLGGTNIIASEGYWRVSETSSLILKCENQLSNCIGGNYGDMTCFEGHIGALCEECDTYGEYWPNGYAKAGDYACTNCDKIKNNSYIVVLMTLWTMISMTIAIRGDIDILENKAGALTIQKQLLRKKTSFIIRPTSSSITKKSSGFGNNKEDEERAGTYIKMLTNYLQIINSLATFNLTLPSGKIFFSFFKPKYQLLVYCKGIYSVPESVGRPLKQTMNSLDCALAEADTEVPIIYLRLMFSLLLPIFYLFLFMICLGITQIFKKGKKFPWYVLSTGIMFLIVYVQPDIVSQVIGLLSCRKIGDKEYILTNVSFECHTDEHNTYSYVFLIPTLIVWTILIPLILYLLLRRKYTSLNDLQTKLRYGFLYKEYKNKAFFWEFVKMGEKIAIILALNFFYQSISVKGLMVFQIIVIYGLLANKVKPYQETFINKIDVYSTYCQAASILLGVFIYSNPYNSLVIIAFIFLIVLNVWFIFKLLLKIISGYVHKVKGLKKTAIEFLATKITYFKKFLPEEKPKKEINPVVRQKMREIFFRFIRLPPKEKRVIILKIVESQLTSFNNATFDRIKKQLMSNIDKEPQSSSPPFLPDILKIKEDKDQIHLQDTQSNQKDVNGELIIFDSEDMSQISRKQTIYQNPTNKQDIISPFDHLFQTLQAEKSPNKILQTQSPYNCFDQQHALIETQDITKIESRKRNTESSLGNNN